MDVSIISSSVSSPKTKRFGGNGAEDDCFWQSLHLAGLVDVTQQLPKRGLKKSRRMRARLWLIYVRCRALWVGFGRRVDGELLIEAPRWPVQFLSTKMATKPARIVIITSGGRTQPYRQAKACGGPVSR